MASMKEQAAVLALVGASRHEWHRTAALIDEAGSALRVLNRDRTGLESFDLELADGLASSVSGSDVDRYEALIQELAARGIKVVTILDDGYPLNLRVIYNAPQCCSSVENYYPLTSAL